MLTISQFCAAAAPWLLLGLSLAVLAVAVPHMLKGGKTKAAGGVIAVFVLAAAFGGLGASAAFAATPTPASTSTSTSSTTRGTAVGLYLGNDYLWVGQSTQIDGLAADNDIIAAGQSIEISGCEVAGSVRLAGQDISVADTSATQSVTLAGQNVRFTGGSALGVALCGQSAVFEGETDSLYIAAQNVKVNGTIHGDLYIAGESIVLGSSLVVDGKVTVESQSDPGIPSGATFGDYEFIEANANTNFTFLGIRYGLSGLMLNMGISNVIFILLMWVVITIAMEWLFRRNTLEAEGILRTRTASMIVSGILCALIAPVALGLTLILLITAPISIALGLTLLAVQIVGGGFMAAVLAKLVLPQMNRFLSALICALVLGVLTFIPYLDVVISVLGFMFTLGYISQAIFMSLTHKEREGGQTPVIEA